MLTIKGLHCGYGGNSAINGIDITIAKGELVTVIGPNGAGKSTLLRTISGLLKPTSGSIIFDGQDLLAIQPDAIVRTGIIHVPEGRMVLGRMSVRENLVLGAYARVQDAKVKRDFEHALALFPILEQRIDQQAGTLSGGEQQMLAIGRGLMGNPRLLMLDEPSLGIAPIIVEKIFAAIADIQSRGVTMLLVEQNAAKALAAADRAYALDLGRMTASGPASALLNDPRVRQAYLGI
ncbi:branched-chain amino acid transport system ATP-binding protein [Rhodoligotrophos appendicifer]|uniref:ABC transporter ATP-binding protein n=1 Tax=Rhodoligotrophos appendicifer TaxID=987056 RepID=UPI001186937A|nr:ABC transporter ATP-binding protein [Rhodoligotrophos appendicifer]